MTDYSIKTPKSWLETRAEIADEMRKWGVDDWITSQQGNRATLSYVKDGKTVDLHMSEQETAKDNLRVLYLAIKSIRLNEVRGIGKIVESNYLQLAEPIREVDPYQILGIWKGAPLSVAEAAYKAKAKDNHPDAQGSVDTMKLLNHAINKIRQEH